MSSPSLPKWDLKKGPAPSRDRLPQPKVGDTARSNSPHALSFKKPVEGSLGSLSPALGGSRGSGRSANSTSSRQLKEHKASNVLISVIRSLSTSPSDAEEREKERRKLQEDFNHSEENVTKLVQVHSSELQQLIGGYRKIRSRLDASRTQVTTVRTELQDCRNLLNLKREEMRKLWREKVEQTHALSLLSQIQELLVVGDRVRSYLQYGYYLHAATVLMKALALLEGGLVEFGALSQIHKELANLKQQVQNAVLEELNRQLYGEEQPAKKVAPPPDLSSHALDLDRELADLEDLSRDPMADKQQLLASLARSLAALRTLQPAVERLKADMQTQLFGVVNTLSDRLLEGRALGFESADSSLLRELLESVLDRFRQCVHKHDLFLSQLSRLSSEGLLPAGLELYDKQDVWAKVQTVTWTVLADYLNFRQREEEVQTTDPARFFTAKREPSGILFRFAESHQAAAIRTYLSERGRDFVEEDPLHRTGLRRFVCQPSPNHLSAGFSLLQQFIEDIEADVGAPERCSLYQHISHFVVKIYIPQLLSSISQREDEETLLSPAQQKALHLERPILLSSLLVFRSLSQVRSVLSEMPLYAADIARLAGDLLRDHVHKCTKRASELTGSALSWQWAKDEDIARLLRSLPNWGQAPAPESSEEVRKRNQRETDMLLRNLQQTPVELMPHPALRHLSSLHSSCVWLSGKLNSFLEPLRTVVPPGEYSSLMSTADGLSTLGETLLLCIHLELRARCFNRLLPLFNPGNRFDDCDAEPDREVVLLAGELTKLDESLAPTLHQQALRYALEGLSHTLAALLIDEFVRCVTKVSENGTRKLCRNVICLQQALSRLSHSKETGLDHAASFFQMLYLKNDQFLSDIREKGVLFTHEQYDKVLALLMERSGNADTPVHLKLKEMLVDVIDTAV